MEIIDEDNIPAILINIDFEMAFDYLEWDFISTALNEYNFGLYITTWVKILYDNIESSVINNGYTPAHSLYHRKCDMYAHYHHICLYCVLKLWQLSYEMRSIS